MENTIMGKRTELDKFLMFASVNAEKFATVEMFAVQNGALRRTLDPDKCSYEVGVVDRPALMKAYVKHVWDERHAKISETGIFPALIIPTVTEVVN